jgi:F-type H+-transporting ATPase subunit gamma
MATKNISEIERNIDAIYQTRHVTNAMYMLSVTAMRRGLANIGYNREYMRNVCTAVKDILEKSPDVRNTFVDSDSYLGRDDAAFLVIASDKSLCGAYNQNVAAEVERQIRRVAGEGRRAIVATAGIKIEEILRNRGVDVYKNFDGASQYPSLPHAYRIAQEVIDAFRGGHVKDVYVIFTDYVSAVKQPVVTHRLLPLAVKNFETVALDRPYAAQMTYVPSPQEAYNKIVRQYLQGFLYGSLCSALVCENLARMTAMQSATRSADEMLNKLEAAYNAARQLQITSELVEIAAATELIKNAI